MPLYPPDWGHRSFLFLLQGPLPRPWRGGGQGNCPRPAGLAINSGALIWPLVGLLGTRALPLEQA